MAAESPDVTKLLAGGANPPSHINDDNRFVTKMPAARMKLRTPAFSAPKVGVQSPFPGSAEKYLSYFPSSPLCSSASGGV
jgi:hypothetical protein